jgi:3-deoxy-D-arabino-heptulosonate 7-phosphate (DAHP) synthase
MVEVHNDPPSAKSDADQALDLGAFTTLVRRIGPIAAAAGRPLAMS